MELSVAPTPSWLCQAELLDRLGKKGSGRRSADILAAAGLQTVFLTEFYTVSLQTVNCVINSLTPTAPNPNLFFFFGIHNKYAGKKKTFIQSVLIQTLQTIL